MGTELRPGRKCGLSAGIDGNQNRCTGELRLEVDGSLTIADVYELVRKHFRWAPVKELTRQALARRREGIAVKTMSMAYIECQETAAHSPSK